jgi:small subunit ribosomal protein S1
VHISELAQHHVENPREVVSQGDLVKARIIEVDAERRRLSLSLKRIDGGGVTEHADDAEAVEGTPNIGLSEEVFPETGEQQAEVVDEAPAEVPETPETPEPEAEADAPAVTPAPEELDASIEADQASPDEQGPGDSEGGPPAPPD